LFFQETSPLRIEGIEQGLTLANKITVTRVLLVPVFVTSLIYHRPGLALLIFIIAGSADAVDGYLARSRGEKTALGAMLDPMADKILMFSAYVLMGIFGYIPAWLAIIVISRDVLISVGFLSLYLALGFVTPSPTLLGKTATVFQMLTIGFALLAWTINSGDQPWLLLLYIPAGALTIASGLHYIFFVGGRMISHKQANPTAKENPPSVGG
jgi:cardiolipin synthase